MPDYERRELGLKGLRLRSVADDYADGRTIEGLAVPFGDVIDTFWDGPETFDRDCEFVDVENAKLGSVRKVAHFGSWPSMAR